MKNIPDTILVKEAVKIIKATLSTNIFNHSMRTYYLGKAYAEKYNHTFSEEELLLASLFHDIGFYAPYKTKNKSFQISSSTALKNFLLTNKNVHPNRINAMMEAIDYHFQFNPRWDKGEIAGLLQTGAHMDAIGKKLHVIDKIKRKDILTEYPKDMFFAEFSFCLFKSLTSFKSITGLFLPESHCGYNHYL